MTGETFFSENIVVGYVGGKAIAQNEWGTLFYAELPEEFVEIGDVLPMSELTPLDELTADEETEIRAALHLEEAL